MSRRLRNGSRAASVLLLFVLLIAPSCDEVSTDRRDDAGTPEARTASDAEINRAARGESGTSSDEESTAQDDGEELISRKTDLAATSAKQVVEATYVHRATDENSRGDYTYLSDPSIDGDPKAVVFAALAADARSDYEHNIGVWYEPRDKKWAIFNQDIAPVPAGTTFEVVVPPEVERFVHRSAPSNASAKGTYLDHPVVNGKPEAEISVTQNWNPGGGNGVYNDHPVGVRYDADRGRWEVFNEDGSAVPDGAAFNVTVSEAARTKSGDVVSIDTGEAPEYEDFFSEGNPQTPKLVSSDSSTGAIPVIRPFNFGRDPGGPDDKTLSLTIPRLDLESVPVFDTLSEQKLRDGTVHIPATGYPWQKGANVYIAGHRIGYEGTGSAHVFFHLDRLKEGDEILLTDAASTEYRYRVTERRVVDPENAEVINAVEGKSLVTLQTCTLPDYEKRLIVQGELVEKRA